MSDLQQINEYCRLIDRIGFGNLMGLPEKMKETLKSTTKLKQKTQMMKEIASLLRR